MANLAFQMQVVAANPKLAKNLNQASSFSRSDFSDYKFIQLIFNFIISMSLHNNKIRIKSVFRAGHTSPKTRNRKKIITSHINRKPFSQSMNVQPIKFSSMKKIKFRKSLEVKNSMFSHQISLQHP